jgi:hypothetical protein
MPQKFVLPSTLLLVSNFIKNQSLETNYEYYTLTILSFLLPFQILTHGFTYNKVKIFVANIFVFHFVFILYGSTYEYIFSEIH